MYLSLSLPFQSYNPLFARILWRSRISHPPPTFKGGSVVVASFVEVRRQAHGWNRERERGGNSNITPICHQYYWLIQRQLQPTPIFQEIKCETIKYGASRTQPGFMGSRQWKMMTLIKKITAIPYFAKLLTTMKSDDHIKNHCNIVGEANVSKQKRWAQ